MATTSTEGIGKGISRANARQHARRQRKQSRQRRRTACGGTAQRGPCRARRKSPKPDGVIVRRGMRRPVLCPM